MKFLILILSALLFNLATAATIPSKERQVLTDDDDSIFNSKDPVWDEGYPLPSCPGKSSLAPLSLLTLTLCQRCRPLPRQFPLAYRSLLGAARHLQLVQGSRSSRLAPSSLQRVASVDEGGSLCEVAASSRVYLLDRCWRGLCCNSNATICNLGISGGSSGCFHSRLTDTWVSGMLSSKTLSSS